MIKLIFNFVTIIFHYQCYFVVIYYYHYHQFITITGTSINFDFIVTIIIILMVITTFIIIILSYKNYSNCNFAAILEIELNSQYRSTYLWGLIILGNTWYKYNIL